MSDKRVSEMTDAEIQDLAAPRPVTYIDASGESFAYQRDHFDVLVDRDMVGRAIATLKARGEYDPARHGDAAKYPPLSVDERLELIARGEVLARHYRHPAYVDNAVQAGATWEQIAAATGSDEARARQQYREWADGQHKLFEHYEGKFGMPDAEYAAAIERTREGAAQVPVPLPGSGVIADYASQDERKQSVRLAEARQQIAKGTSYIPPEERETAALEARSWLRAAARAQVTRSDPEAGQ